jgi:hypothetical protein
MMVVINKEYPSAYDNMLVQAMDNSDLVTLLGHIKNERFMESKYQLVEMNNLRLNIEVYNFYGSENRFTNFICCFLRYQMSSVCSSRCCPAKEKSQRIDNIPSISRAESASKETFSSALIDWLCGTWSAPCNIRHNEPLHAESFITWDKNALTYDNFS